MKEAAKKIIVIILLVTSMASAGSCSPVPVRPHDVTPGDYEDTKEYTSRLIRKEMKKFDVTGLSIALVSDQRIVWAEGFGYADKANGISATPLTIYRAGSIAKLFTATAVMQLAEQGRIDIDKPLQAYLPQFSIKTRFPNAGPITLRSLMTHHSGLPTDLAKGMWSNTPEPFTNVVKEIKDEYAAYPPNYVFSYSNLGMTLLGHAYQTVVDRDFVSAVDDRLLKPLNMIYSSFAPETGKGPLVSKSYRDGKETEEPLLRDIPSSGLQTNVIDLGKFMQMVFAGGRSGEHQVLRPETIAEMLRPQNAGVPLDLNFHVGLGWALSGVGNIDIRNAGPVAHHSGSTLLFHSQLIILPEYKLGVVVLANSSTSGSVVSRVATEALKLALEAKAGIKQPEMKKPEETGGAVTPAQLDRYEGKYATLMGLADITKRSDSLRVEVLGKTFRLVPTSDGQFGLRYRFLGLIPISLGELEYMDISRATVAGHEILLVKLGEQELLIGEKIVSKAVPGSWMNRTGEYEITNGGTDFLPLDNIRLRYENDLLLLEFSMPVISNIVFRYALSPVSDDEAVIDGLGGRMGETISVVRVNGKEGLRYSGYVLKRRKR